MTGDRPRSGTHFGYRTVAEDEKATLVGEVFRSVAGRYDLMNDLMSFGAHRAWKRFALDQSGVRAGNRVLDVAGGSGDMTDGLSGRVGPEGLVVLSDINEAMLQRGRERLVDRGRVGNVRYVRADAENLCFADREFACVSIAFGLRNVTRMERALASMQRVVRPGGRLLVLEFSQPTEAWLGAVYDAYSFGVIPRLGRWVAGDEASYRYLVESIRKHPGAEQLKQMMLDAGFDDVRFYRLSGGIVALHVGFRY